MVLGDLRHHPWVEDGQGARPTGVGCGPGGWVALVGGADSRPRRILGYQAGTDHLVADPDLMGLTPVAWAVLAAATAARTAGQSAPAGALRSARMLLGAGATA